MLGTVGLTCAFPFAGDELYGQHVHVTLAQAPAAGVYTPAFFTPAEYATLSRLTDAIIPPTDTPGASGAGVPEYIDRVVSLNGEHQTLVRQGLAWLEQQSTSRFARDFGSLDEVQQAEILQPLSDEVDRQRRETQRGRFRADAKGGMIYDVAVTDRTSPPPPSAPARPVTANDPDMPVRLFRLIKNLTADGYYTSRVGLLDELGYVGNTARGSFPSCDVREH
jgi:hypothetical protein